MIYTVAIEQMTLDEICWQFYETSVDVIEPVLAANPGLAQYQPFLPVGLQIYLPDKPAKPVTNTIRLWD